MFVKRKQLIVISLHVFYQTTSIYANIIQNDLCVDIGKIWMFSYVRHLMIYINNL